MKQVPLVELFEGSDKPLLERPVPGSGREATPGWRSLGSREEVARAVPERRGGVRKALRLAARTSTIDPVPDVRTGAASFLLSDEDHTLDLSRRGVCLLCERPPQVGTRLLVQLTLDPTRPPIDLIGRACWTRVEFEPGDQGGRPRCRVGLEILGGATRALDRLERAWAAL